MMTFRREDGVAENFRTQQNRELLEKLATETQRQILQTGGSSKDSGRNLIFGSWHLGPRDARPLGYADLLYRRSASPVFGMAAAPEMGNCMRTAVLVLLAAASAGATTHCVVVAGLGGEPDYEQRFATWAQDLDKTLRATQDVQVETFSGANATAAITSAPLSRVSPSEATADDSLVRCSDRARQLRWDRLQDQHPGPGHLCDGSGDLLDRVKAGGSWSSMRPAPAAVRSSPAAAEPDGHHGDQGGYRKERDCLSAVLDRGAP